MLAVGLGFFGFAFASVCDISLTYLTDCYRDVRARAGLLAHIAKLLITLFPLEQIVGDALVAVAFFRNAVATAIVFALDPWIDAIGLANMFVSASCISVGVLLLILPMLYWGKKARFSSARRYEMMAKLQPSHRPL
jgi:hypothetical protein